MSSWEMTCLVTDLSKTSKNYPFGRDGNSKIIHNRKSVSYKKIPGGTIEINALKGDLSGYYI